MKPIRFVLSGVALLLSVAWLQAQDKPPAVPPLPDVKANPQPFPVPPPFGGPSSELVSAKGLEKLALSKEQKADYDKVAEEYKKKQKEMHEKFLDLTKNFDPNALKAHFEAQQKLRPDYLAKVEKLLTDEQKKTFESVRNEGPGFGPGIGFPPPFGRPFGPAIGASFLPAEAQKQLKLSDDQKKKVDELQKELEANIMKLLTDEQKKAFDELKKRPGGFGPGGGIGVPPYSPPPLDLPKLPLERPKLPPPGLDKQVNPLPPAVEPTRPPEVKKIEK